MSGPLPGLADAASWFAWTGIWLVLGIAGAVSLERLYAAAGEAWLHRLDRRYGALVRAAHEGNPEACRTLARSPARHRIPIARLLLAPLIEHRDPARIAATRAAIEAMALVPAADRLLRSRRWWKRALGLRVFGLLQFRDRTPRLLAALDDANADVRGTALDALADMRDPRTLPALALRLADESLHRGRRAAIVTAFGAACEPAVLAAASARPEHRLYFARALAECGTARSRAALCRWTEDPRMDVRVAAFEALARVGLNRRAAVLAVQALESRDGPVRAMAARALQGWAVATEALARHLDDEWSVAASAARALKASGPGGHAALNAQAARTDLAGVLARQMLWEVARQ